MTERITVRTPPEERLGHEFRYRLATTVGTVLDAACGSGYGSRFFPHAERYVGVDRTLADLEPGLAGEFVQADLTWWQPDFEYDTFVGFETLEHIADYGNYLNVATAARYRIFMSVPVVPTVGENPYHVHDFKPGDLRRLVENDVWKCLRTIDQPSELAEICIFGRRNG